jgi:hypothetical protein
MFSELKIRLAPAPSTKTVVSRMRLFGRGCLNPTKSEAMKADARQLHDDNRRTCRRQALLIRSFFCIERKVDA